MKPSDEWKLPTRHIGRRVWLFDRIDSTNTHAMTLADDSNNDGLVLLAEEQTAGRGQYGRSWQSLSGKSVLMSLLLFPEGRLRQPAVLTAWAAVAVCTLIERVAGLQASIKWPNDVMIHGQKICGILIEQQVRSGRLAAVVGLGLNISQTQQDFEDANLPFATSLAIKAQQLFDPKVLARALIGVMDEEYYSLHTGEVQQLQVQWQERLDLIGKRVMAEAANQRVIGKLTNLSFERVELEIGGGKYQEFRPEIVQRLTVL